MGISARKATAIAGIGDAALSGTADSTYQKKGHVATNDVVFPVVVSGTNGVFTMASASFTSDQVRAGSRINIAGFAKIEGVPAHGTGSGGFDLQINGYSILGKKWYYITDDVYEFNVNFTWPYGNTHTFNIFGSERYGSTTTSGTAIANIMAPVGAYSASWSEIGNGVDFSIDFETNGGSSGTGSLYEFFATVVNP